MTTPRKPKKKFKWKPKMNRDKYITEIDRLNILHHRLKTTKMNNERNIERNEKTFNRIYEEFQAFKHRLGALWDPKKHRFVLPEEDTREEHGRGSV